MTFEQLTIFVAVADCEHLTRAAETLNLTPSAVSSAIRKLEAAYDVELFHRVGRGIELSPTGRAFVEEARATLARTKAAERVLGELGGLQRGALSLYASQTIASYWLPQVLMRFHDAFPGIELSLTISNTAGVAEAMTSGHAEIGFIEGSLQAPHLTIRHLAEDALVVVTAPDHPFAQGQPLPLQALLTQTSWIMREQGSGTRSEFENALTGFGLDLQELAIALTLPSNEAVVSAVRNGAAATAISAAVAAPYLQQGLLVRAAIDLPSRAFCLLSHKERRLSKAADAMVAFALEAARAERPV